MNCYQHPEKSAIGVCPTCHKGICQSCTAINLEAEILSCNNNECRQTASNIHRIIKNNARLMTENASVSNWLILKSAIANFIFGVIFIVIGYQFYHDFNLYWGLPFAGLGVIFIISSLLNKFYKKQN